MIRSPPGERPTRYAAARLAHDRGVRDEVTAASEELFADDDQRLFLRLSVVEQVPGDLERIKADHAILVRYAERGGVAQPQRAAYPLQEMPGRRSRVLAGVRVDEEADIAAVDALQRLTAGGGQHVRQVNAGGGGDPVEAEEAGVEMDLARGQARQLADILHGHGRVRYERAQSLQVEHGSPPRCAGLA